MSAPPIPRYNVLGVGISALNLTQARDLVLNVRGSTRRGYICLGTAHGLTEAQRDPELRRIYNESWLTTPDGRCCRRVSSFGKESSSRREYRLGSLLAIMSWPPTATPARSSSSATSWPPASSRGWS